MTYSMEMQFTIFAEKMYRFGLNTKVQFAAYSPMQDVAVQRSHKMQRVIQNKQPLKWVEREDWEMATWITPEIPRGFFNTTNRTAY